MRHKPFLRLGLILIFLFLLSSLSLFKIKNQAFSVTDILSPWSITTTAPYQVASHGVFAENGKLYLVGGATFDDYSQVWSSSIDSLSGVLSSWQSETSLPETRYWAANTKKDNRIYIVSGAKFDGSTSLVNTVYSATIQGDGSISSWQTLTPLPDSAGLGGAVIVGDFIYFAGGFNSGIPKQNIYYAPINANGTIGNWVTSAISLPFPMYSFGMVAYQNNIITVGGVINGIVTNKVYKSSVNPADGSISPWQETSSLPGPQNGQNHTILVGNKLMTVGGGDNSGPLKTVYYTDVNSDGTVQPWAISTNQLPVAVGASAVVFSNGYLYISGGFSGGYLNTVYKTKLVIPTPTLTPTPTPVNLDVNLLKQTDSQWGSQVYDTANIWSPSSQGISAWGCALTSAAMVFQYHGITKLPDGTTLNPKTLNVWLKGQNDGYVGNGFVNWLALTRLSKLSPPQNPSFNFDALEYKRIGGYNPTQLTNDLKNNIPGILEVPGHFIVGKGITATSFNINDPFHARTLLSEYSNSFLSLGRFVPSNTDLSYMMFVVDNGLNITVKNGNGDLVGEGFTQSPLDEDGGIKKNGPSLNYYYVPVPTTGSFNLEIKSDTQKSYTLQSFFYDEAGNVKKITQNGVSNDLFSISYNKTNSSSSNLSEEVSFDKLIADLDYLYSKKLITNSGVYLSLRAKALQAKKLSSSSKNTAKVIMDSFIIQLNSNRKKMIKEEAYLVLYPEALALLKTLQ